MVEITPGMEAPDFTLPTDSGESFRLSSHRGRPVVLFFYPQDDTEGCTVENIEFTGLMPEFEKLGAVVVGISPDTTEDHCRFRSKHALGTLLLADPQRSAVEAYGVWGPKTTFGRDYVGLLRTTFLIDRDGTVSRVWTVSRIKGHAQDVLDATRQLAQR